MGKASMGLRSAALAAAAAMVLAACGGGGSDDGDSGATGDGGGEPTKGGTLTFLTVAEQIDHLDPQRNYTGEDLAFASAYLTRTLTSYKMSTDDAEANSIIGDLATDTGTPNEDATSWQFTLKDGITFEDGSPVTCEDVKYGVSRTFATDVITDGPQYAVSYLDIPKDEDGSSVYKGPYNEDGAGQEEFDQAVQCDGNTITFNLANPVADFNYTVTLTAFAPVPKAADTGESYDDKPVSTGPYKIVENSPGNQLVLERNENWDPETETDGYRPAYPDRIVMKFGIEPTQRDQRIIRSSGEDAVSASRDQPDPSSLATIFNDDRLADRRADVLDAYAYYYGVDVNKVPNLQHRQALAAALDRAQIIKVSGGDYAGEVSDGVIKENLPQDYAPSGMWTELLGQEIPDSGDPDYAKQLIEESGEPMPDICFNYSTPTRDKEAAVVKQSLEAAGIKVQLKPLEAGQYYSIVFDPEKACPLMWLGWGPDWPNASTIIPELFTPSGGFNLSRVDDADFNARVDEARAETDRDAQAEIWKELNKEAMSQVWAIPTRAGRSQAVWGDKVHSASGEDGKVYLWSPYTSYPYHDMWVEQ
jgi:peptide/nickel transport system substrate-binding protein